MTRTLCAKLTAGYVVGMSVMIVYEQGPRSFNGVLWNEVRSPDKEGVFKALLLVNINNMIHLVICEKHHTESSYKDGLVLPFSIEHAHSFIQTYLEYLATCSPYQAEVFRDNCLVLLESSSNVHPHSRFPPMGS